MKFKNAVPVAFALMASTACVPTPEPECYQRPIEKEGPWILSDHYHARKQNQEDYVLDKRTFNYQGVFGFRRVFDHLERGGFNWTSTRTMELSPERLEGFDTLFINLLSNDRPDFTDDEVQTIMDFVEDGGGLFVIADHTNVYDHAERINRFLIPMGIEVLYHIAVDFPPEHSVAGLGWILVTDFAEHPVTEGLDMISLQTGGPMEGGGVAFSSSDSFADLWDPEDEGGYYGNWTWDGDEEVEPRGPLEVHNAVEYGAGRVVVAGDQNMFGDAWAHWGDNFEVFMNSMEWVSQQDGVGDMPLRDLDPFGTLIAVDQTKNGYFGGKPGADGGFSFFVNMNRDREATSRGSIRLANEEDAVIFVSPNIDFTEGELTAVREYLNAGKKVVLTFDPTTATTSVQGFLAEFAPDFSMKSAGDSFDVTTLPTVTPTKLNGAGSISATGLDLEGTLGIYDLDPYEVEDGDDEPTPYLWDLTSDWGDSLVRAEVAGKTVDIMRSKAVNDGELIVIFQDALFRNRSLGYYLRAPGDLNRGANDLQFALIDYLKVDERPMPPQDSDEQPPSRVCR